MSITSTHCCSTGPTIPEWTAESFPAAAELRNEGLVEHLGVSQYMRRQLERAGRPWPFPFVCDQVLYLPSMDPSELLEYCQRQDIVLTIYSPLARGGVLETTRSRDRGPL
jgi:diketogulonate reductase-like aldo/keto reductase